MIILVMGIEGSGKTTVGRLLAERLHYEFADADDFHSSANKEKMSRGIALNDADRGPWLAAIRDQMVRWIAAKQNGVITCSALKQSYRDFLLSAANNSTGPAAEIKILYLRGSYALLQQRVHSRKGHFASEALLASQFATLEEPTGVVTIDVDQPPERIVDQAIRELHIDQPTIHPTSPA
jgi:gluconokinase